MRDVIPYDEIEAYVDTILRDEYGEVPTSVLAKEMNDTFDVAQRITDAVKTILEDHGITGEGAE